MKKTNALLLLTIFTLCACSRGKASAPAAFLPSPPPNRTTLELDSLAPAGCLNLANYFSGINALDPALLVTEVSTDFDLKSTWAIRANFRQLMAYTNFRLSSRPLADFHEFQGVMQTDCETITTVGADGAEEVYKVKNFSRDSISAEHEDGRSLHYQWLGPERMRVELKYSVYDLPCTKGNPIWARLTRVVDWSGAPLTEIPLPESPFAVNEELLQHLAESVGRTTAELFAEGPGSARILLVEKAREMAALPVKEELLACEIYSPPPPIPEEEVSAFSSRTLE